MFDFIIVYIFVLSSLFLFLFSLCACACSFVPLCFYLSQPESVFVFPDRLWRPLGFLFYSPLCPAGSDPRTLPESIALIPSSLSPRLPSSAPSRGHSVHGRQSSTPDRPQLHERGYRWQVHPAEVHHQGAGSPSRVWRDGLWQTASGFASQSCPGEVCWKKRAEAEGDLLPLLWEEGSAHTGHEHCLALGPLCECES